MLCTVVQDTYGPAEVGDVANSLKQLLTGSHDWSETGVYCYWDPDTQEALYLGLATNLPERFAQHNGLVRHGGGNKRDEIQRWFRERDALGVSVILQSAAVAVMQALHQRSPTLGALPEDLIAVGEGQLLEMHRRAFGRLPRWNRVGGSTLGQRWTATADVSMLDILRGATPSLFVARRSIRDLVADERSQRFEAAVHTARMRAVLESHEVGDDGDLEQEELMYRIIRLLMVQSGHLPDELAVSDEAIRRWVRFLSSRRERHAEARAVHRDVAQLMAQADGSDHDALALIGGLMAPGHEGDEPEVLAEVVSSGYLNEPSPVPTVGASGSPESPDR